MIITLVISCTPSNDPPPDPPDQIVSNVSPDSITTWSKEIPFGNCDSAIPDLRYAQKYRFFYDTAGRITKMLDYTTVAGAPAYQYDFAYTVYNNLKQLSEIDCSNYFDANRGDKIYVYDQNNITFADLAISGTTTQGPYLMRLKQTENTDSIDVRIISTRYYSDTIFHAVMKKDADGNVRNIVYYRANPFPGRDTSMMVTNTFYTSRPNPYYGIYEKIKFPLFLLLSFGNQLWNLQVTDLSQLYSKNCIAHSQEKIFVNQYCTGVPGWRIKDYNYDLSDYYTFDGQHVTKIRDVAPDYYNLTPSGFINMNATFTFH
ncbi:MAG: hypothetical protein ABI480_03700 [Chitinophagaceae bacterium]